MKLRERFFESLAALLTNHSGKVLVGCLLLTIAMIAAATRLGFKTQIADMMPADIPMIQEYLEIIEDYSSDATVMITIESEDKNTNRMHEVAEDLASRLESVYLVKPSEGVKLSFGQRIALMNGKFPPEISYDTLNLVRRIDYKLDNDFFSEHGMIIQKPNDLENMLTMFGSLDLPDLLENINNNFEQEFIEDSDNLTSLDGEAQAVQGLEGINRFLQSMELFLESGDSAFAAEAVSEFVSGPQYMVSSDNSMLLMMLQPSISFNDFEDIMYLGYRIDDTLSVVGDLYPDIQIGRTGLVMVQIDENNALANDFGWPSLIALGLILVLLIGAFRDWKYPLLTVVALVAGIIWTTGILALVFGYLNVMSAGFGIVLVGLGIDFGIHFISGFRDGREHGKSVGESLSYMYDRVGAGVVTGALTTAIVFFCLQFTQFEAYSQLGVSTGIGIISVLLAQMILLPALIVWDHKGYSVTAGVLNRAKLGFVVAVWSGFWGKVFSFFRLPFFDYVCKPLQFGFLGTSGRLLGKMPVAIGVLAVSAVLMVFSIFGGLNMEWEYDLMKLQPEGTPSMVAQNNIIEKFELSPDYAMVKARDIEECRFLVEEFKRVGNRTGLIGAVDAITEFLPEESTQIENIVIIEEFRENLLNTPTAPAITEQGMQKLKQELIRLHQNIVEIGEMSVMSSGEDNKIIRKCDQIVGRVDEESFVLALADKLPEYTGDLSKIERYQMIASEVLKDRLLTMAGTSIVTLDNLPEDIRKRYVNPNNDDLLITVFPKGYIWDENTLNTFNEQTSGISERITGMPAIIQLLMDLMAEKGRDALIIGAIAIILFLFIDFGSLKFTLLAVIPLAVGAVWMVGLMAASGMKLSIMNFTALPLIIGIGIDDGVHMLHRYRIEGKGSVPVVLRFTGRAILLTSLTTMIGFGSMGLASHVGIAMFGLTLFYGVGACFVSSAYVLPAIITVIEKFSGNKKETPQPKTENISADQRRKECV
ncbi:hopanoid biosynthesis associated RND transporter [Chitinispirillum alkaliphilum]|nr:hopanoid biosynthesis associated RND transporter [Chitinispirillum alkaliphilum]